MRPLLSEVILRKVCQLHHMSEQTCLEWMIAMNRDRESYIASGFSVDVMTTFNSQQCPAMAFEYFGKLFARVSSYSYFKYPVTFCHLCRRDVDRQAPFNRFIEIL